MPKKPINYWSAVDGGFRGSVLLRLGAVLSACGALTNMGAELLGSAAGASANVTTVAWLIYIAALWLLGSGFLWVGSHPYLTRFGFVVGALHIVQGFYLLVLLFTTAALPVPPVSLTVGRLLATVMFALIEKESLAPRLRLLIGLSAGALLLKATLRAGGIWPALPGPFSPLIDVVFLLVLAAAMLQLASAVRSEEDTWAKMIYETKNADFADFNNPEHEWNKSRR